MEAFSIDNESNASFLISIRDNNKLNLTKKMSVLKKDIMWE